MLRFLLDENLRGPLWHAAQRHNTRGAHVLDITRVGEVPELPLGSGDPAVLIWAEQHDRVLVSMDKSTLPMHLKNHLGKGHRCPGVFLIRRGCALREIIEFLVLASYASEPADWQNRIHYIGGIGYVG